jgi:low molecular weight phosphotyrosine protein phosphatase
MAEGIFESLTSKPPYKDLIKTLDSAGTGAYHTGAEPDDRTMSTLQANGISTYDHAARKVGNTASTR